MKARALAAAVAVAAIMIPAFEARANCAIPLGHAVQETSPGHVRICLQNFGIRRCPDKGLLRRAVDGGAIVQITQCDEQGCFLDECVPAGRYEYGLAVPYVCSPSSCSTEYYTPVTVAGSSGACVRRGVAPVAAAEVPWESGCPRVCGYRGTLDPRCPPKKSTSRATSILGANLAVLLAGLALWRRPGPRRPRA